MLHSLLISKVLYWYTHTLIYLDKQVQSLHYNQFMVDYDSDEKEILQWHDRP